MMLAASWDHTGDLPAPPGLIRPHNAYFNAESWESFDDALAGAVPFSPDLPVARWLSRIAETLRQSFPHQRGAHPLLSFLAVGTHAQHLIAAQRLDWPLGPIQALADLDGHVLLLGVSHTSNTTIHLAEQLLGRSLFYRYAKAGPGVWMELPNLSGHSHSFDEIEPELAPATAEVRIGRCRARVVAVRDVLACATRLIRGKPGRPAVRGRRLPLWCRAPTTVDQSRAVTWPAGCKRGDWNRHRLRGIDGGDYHHRRYADLLQGLGIRSPHGLTTTHKDQLNADLLEFAGVPVPSQRATR